MGACTHQTKKLGPCPCLQSADSCLLFSQGSMNLETVWQDVVFCPGQIPLRELIFCSWEFLSDKQPLLIKAHVISWRNQCICFFKTYNLWIFLLRGGTEKKPYMPAASCACDGILGEYLGAQMMVQWENWEQNTRSHWMTELLLRNILWFCQNILNYHLWKINI